MLKAFKTNAAHMRMRNWIQCRARAWAVYARLPNTNLNKKASCIVSIARTKTRIQASISCPLTMHLKCRVLWKSFTGVNLTTECTKDKNEGGKHDHDRVYAWTCFHRCKSEKSAIATSNRNTLARVHHFMIEQKL